MKNRFINQPSVDDAVALQVAFEYGNNGIIALSQGDFLSTLRDASACVAVETKASGADRMKNALGKLPTACATVAPGLNLFDAESVLFLIVINRDIIIKELDHFTDFFSQFGTDANIIWGVARTTEGTVDDIAVRLLASFKTLPQT